MKEESYFRFFTFGLSKFADRSLIKIREKIFHHFLDSFTPNKDQKILDVGVSADDHPSSNIFEKYYPHTHAITAVGLGDFSELEQVYPGLTYRKVDGRTLPFANHHFDYVYSHAVIEHVGSAARQIEYIKELYRVAKTGVMFTTPNRNHPIEFHTGLPFMHYLPGILYRKIYQLFGKNFYAVEENLILLRKSDIKKLVHSALGSTGYQIQFKYTFWPFPLAANIIVIIKKALL